MSKGLGAAIGIAAVVIVAAVAGGGAYYLGFLSLPSATAKLTAASGDVSVNGRAASLGTDLRENDVVKTGPGSSAEITFFGSSVVRLDENTEVRISDLIESKESRTIKLDQPAGNTWNRVLLASGINTYEIATPTSVASVRGTAFYVRIVEGAVDVGVTEGIVNLKSIKDGAVVTEADIDRDKAGVVRTDALETIDVQALVRDAWVTQNEQKDGTLREEVKDKIRSKYGNLIGIAKSQYGVTDTQVEEYLDAYVGGEYTREDVEALKRQYGITIDLEI